MAASYSLGEIGTYEWRTWAIQISRKPKRMISRLSQEDNVVVENLYYATEVVGNYDAVLSY